MPFLRGTSGGVLKCRLFFQAITRQCTMFNLSIHRINVLLSVHSHWLCVTLDVIVILSHAKSIKWRTLGLVPLQRRTFNTTFYNPSHKSWNTCVIFPFPMLIWVCSHFSAPKYARNNIGEGEGHIWVRTKMWRVNVRSLEKIQDKWLLFQRFVTSIVAW